MINARHIIGLVFFACGILSAMMFSFVTFEMVERVNERLPQDQQFSPGWWYWSKQRRLWREYKRLYPEGSLLTKLGVRAALMLVCGFVSAWGFGVIQ